MANRIAFSFCYLGKENGQTNRQHKDLQIYKYKGNKLGVEYYYSDLQVTMNDADKLNFTLLQGRGQNKVFR